MKRRRWWTVFVVTVTGYLFVVIVLFEWLGSPISTVDDVQGGDSYYVTVDTKFIARYGLGNQMFALAAAVHVAELTGRKVAIFSDRKLALGDVFELDVEQLSTEELCPCFQFSEPLFSGMRYNRRLEQLSHDDTKSADRHRSLVLHGFFQSWKYAASLSVRRRLAFRRQYANFAASFLDANVPPEWTTGSYSRVGVHVRRGDFLRLSWIGFTVASADYFLRAMGYFVERFGRVQFVVCGNDWDWIEPVLRHLAAELGPDVNVTFSKEHSPGEDMAILAACDHSIVSTGSFGWWASWLANGTTVYYADWPKNGSPLHADFVAKDYFPLHWIGMT